MGFNVLIFHEATTSDGNKLRPFKSSLLKLAENNSISLTAYCLKYTHLNSKPATAVDMIRTISWYENAGFLPHVFQQFANHNVFFKLTEVDTLISSELPDRKSLVHRLENSIANEFNNSNL
jgi:1-acyl-sn-glycerol-3-phosphate acyltransferase